MEELAVNALDPVALDPLEYNFKIYSAGLIALIVTIVYSVRNGGIKEVVENLFLWLLLFFGILKISLHPVDAGEEMTAGVFFLAFGLCRIAKNMAKKD